VLGPNLMKSSLARILIADDDAWMSRMLATVLTRRGYEVETAGDGATALARAIARPPDLLITDAMMPVLDGWGLVRELRARAELAHIPVIFLSALSSDDDRMRGFRLGADAYITKPFRYEEIDLRVSTTLRRARQIVEDARAQLERACLRGTLEQVGISALLFLLENEKKSGRLVLRGGGVPDVELWLRDGRLVRAALLGASEAAPLPDVACVHRVLTWTSGDFEFTPRAVDGPDRIGASMTHLLLESARLHDEAGR